jgi:hypothetical protein
MSRTAVPATTMCRRPVSTTNPPSYPSLFADGRRHHRLQDGDDGGEKRERAYGPRRAAGDDRKSSPPMTTASTCDTITDPALTCS